jgi:hypothetical protein
MSNKRRARPGVEGFWSPPPGLTPRLAELMSRRPGLYVAHYAHDDWCPALRSHRVADCTCSPDVSVIHLGTGEVVK